MSEPTLPFDDEPVRLKPDTTPGPVRLTPTPAEAVVR